jgi:diguanylate cyclase (GGDEF)-like protein
VTAIDGPAGEPAQRRRWHRAAQILLVLTMAGALAGVLGIVVQNSVFLGRMTTDVSIAQERTTNLHNLQRETLRLLQQLTELKPGGDVEAVTVRRGLVRRMLIVVQALFPADSREGMELQRAQAALDGFPWVGLVGSDLVQAAYHAAAKTTVSQAETRIKNLYDEQEKFFYAATIASLKAKRDTQTALVVLVLLVVVLALCSLVLLRRRTRSRLVGAYAALLAEVSERRTLQDQLTHQAFHDALTGLPNRALFLRRLGDLLAGTSSGVASAILIDLDGFKDVNDTLGHSAGDELLQRTAERLQGCVRSGDTVARLGGDEFAIALAADSPGEALAVAQRVVAALRHPVMVAGQEIIVNASIGIAQRDDQAGAEELLSDADIAMYAAKKAGKARYEVFQPGMRDRTRQRLRVEQQLARAVEMGEIEVHYQPIIDLATGRVLAMEALARWRHPEEGLVPPGVFIPIAEESGLIREIGRDVLRQACRTVQQWRAAVPGRDDLSVTVNVSVRQLLSGAFAEHLHQALDESGLPAAQLTLEITESMLLEESDAVTAELERIKAAGVRLAMDDFGAGYSSIASLLRLRVNVLKIDKSFVDLDHRNRGTLVRAVTELGHSLGLTVVAEGVETPEQMAHLRAANCDAAQGYLLSRPMPAARARDYLAAEPAHAAV